MKELIRLLGDVMQLAFVPADVDATIIRSRASFKRRANA